MCRVPGQFQNSATEPDDASGAVIFTDISGELAEAVITERFYPDVSALEPTLVWGAWRKPSHAELVGTWPSRRPPDKAELARGWWQATIEELREERRKARSTERAQTTRQLQKGAN